MQTRLPLQAKHTCTGVGSINNGFNCRIGGNEVTSSLSPDEKKNVAHRAKKIQRRREKPALMGKEVQVAIKIA